MKKSAIIKSDFPNLIETSSKLPLYLLQNTKEDILENIGNQTLVPSDFNVTSQNILFHVPQKKGRSMTYCTCLTDYPFESYLVVKISHVKS